MMMSFGIEFSLSLVKIVYLKKRSQYNVIGYNKGDIFGHQKTASSF